MKKESSRTLRSLIPRTYNFCALLHLYLFPISPLPLLQPLHSLSNQSSSSPTTPPQSPPLLSSLSHLSSSLLFSSLTGKKSKPKMGAGESVKFLSQSPYIRDLAALVVGYGMAINIVEVRTASYVSCPLLCFSVLPCHVLSCHVMIESISLSSLYILISAPLSFPFRPLPLLSPPFHF